ncbi:PKS-ER domain-containing protein [Mycena kentingensis (nom. inval.)]|nr:PKS-ER domain-containing protein [Mycena kentingensis (nom. inval.)]
MAPVTNAREIFAAVPNGVSAAPRSVCCSLRLMSTARTPTGYPVPGQSIVHDTTQTIDLETAPLNGGVLIKTLVLSVDPYFRGRMREAHVPSYLPAFVLGDPIVGAGIGVVLRSECEGVPVGSHVRGALPHQEYTIAPSLENLQIIERDPKLSLSAYIGAAGMPGETAYMGWKEYSKAKEARRSRVYYDWCWTRGLIAKQAGLKVIASAGSDAKVAYMKELGADVAFNYKTSDVRDVLKKEGPIDIYWDNVGGDQLDAAMENANRFARFIECGQISGYNDNATPMKSPMLMISKCLTFNGFLVAYLRPKYTADFAADVVPKLADGTYKYQEDKFVWINKVGDALAAVLKGTNNGKAVVVVAEE